MLRRSARRLRHWLQLPSRERRATLALAALVPVVSASLWVVGFKRTAGWVEWSARRGRGAVSPVPVVVGDGVAALSRVRRYTPWSGRCLARALGLWWLLRRGGVVAVLHLGVRMAAGELDAHAWVTHDGRVLADSESVWTDFPGSFASDGNLGFGERGVSSPPR